MSAAWFVCNTPTKGSLSSLLLFPVYFLSRLSLFLLLKPLSLNVSVQQRGAKLCFVLWGSHSGKKVEGGFCVLICWPVFMLWVWKGLKHITKLICPLYQQPTINLHYLPPSSPLSLFHCLLLESSGQWSIAPLRLAARVGLWFPDFESFVLPGSHRK